jgi:hypothetical protein
MKPKPGPATAALKRAKVSIFPTEHMEVATLRPHARNYRSHPEDQIDHLVQSLREHGFYRNVVVAVDGTILAGHGIVLAAQRMGMKAIPVVRLKIDANHPQALKLLMGDNEIEHLGEVDDRLLTELLKEVQQDGDDGLLGTGYDEAMLANLLFVTRPASEIESKDDAALWAGMPEFEPAVKPLNIVVSFDNMADRAKFLKLIGMTNATDKTKSVWYPIKARKDLASLKFEGGARRK